MVRGANKRRRPARPASTYTAGEGSSPISPLRLAVTKGGLGLELADSFELALFKVQELSVSLVGLNFPVDLSGGVARFRHRRGALERMALTIERERAIRALAPRFRGILGEGTPALTLAPVAAGVLVGLTDANKALAFELFWAPSERDARWVVSGARSVGLRTPALASALHAVDALAGRAAERSGSLVAFPEAPAELARQVLPSLGARAPEANDLRWGALEGDIAGWRVACDRSFSPPLLPKHVVGELELARLAQTADADLAAGNIDDARQGYAALLERAPRDADIARRLADIDRAVGGRAEAALATLLEAMPLREAGVLGGELLAAAGRDIEAADAFEEAAQREPYGPLASLAFLRSAELTETIKDRLRRLDEAVARAPSLAGPRWVRLALRLELADLAGAMGDAEHLEAASRGAHARHAVWRRVAEEFFARGHAAKAVTLFERALRYMPDSPQAIAGLARSMLAAGRSGRALDLMARAVELAERQGAVAHDVVLTLARSLADASGNLPHAIARLRSIPPGVPETLDARGLEGRYRAALGDLAGASIAFATLRDTIELGKGIDPGRAVVWLLEAARFEQSKKDPVSAQRHLGVALSLAPRDGRVLSLFREAAREAAGTPRADAPVETAGAYEPPASPPDGADSAFLEQRAEALSDKLRADPANQRVAVELCQVLARLGRDLDLFALTSARLEEAAGSAREELLPHHRAVLERLLALARAEGRHDEAELYAEALERLKLIP
jgi:cellulose synthase operon protein C